MAYINTETNQYPVTEADIRAASPENTSFPHPFVPEAKYQVVFETPKPTINIIKEVVIEAAPVLTVKGTWEQTWTVQQLALDAVAVNLAAAKEQKRQAINAKRDDLEKSGFTYNAKVFDSNSVSVQRINTVVQAAQIAISTSTPFSIDWTCADNSVMTLDAAGVLGMVMALALRGAAIHTHAKILKDQVLLATADTIDTIDITAGWPAL